MYGVEAGFSYEAGDPVAPLGPGVQKLEDWWFKCASSPPFSSPTLTNCRLPSCRGPRARALKPQNDSVMELPAGGTAKIEIACKCVPCSCGPSYFFLARWPKLGGQLESRL